MKIGGITKPAVPGHANCQRPMKRVVQPLCADEENPGMLMFPSGTWEKDTLESRVCNSVQSFARPCLAVVVLAVSADPMEQLLSAGVFPVDAFFYTYSVVPPKDLRTIFFSLMYDLVPLSQETSVC